MTTARKPVEPAMKIKTRPFEPAANIDKMTELMNDGQEQMALFYGLRALERGHSQPRLLVKVLTLAGKLGLRRLAMQLTMGLENAEKLPVSVYIARAKGQAAAAQWDLAKQSLQEAEEAYPGLALVSSTRTRIETMQQREKNKS